MNQELWMQFIALANEIESLEDALSAKRKNLQEMMLALDVGSFGQDPNNGVVYQIVEPAGTFITFRKIDYIRTKKEGERQGTLSMKKAEEAGFIL